MAINFPSTAGQATDGSYTYNVAGIIYAWNGSSWEAAGAGASATDRTLFSVTQNSAGTAALSYNSNTGVFSYTPPNLSSYLTTETDPVFTASAAGSITSTQVTNWDTAYGWGNHASAGYLTTLSLNGLSDVSISSPSTNQVLTYNGSSWVNQSLPVSLASRQTAQVTQSVANGASVDVSISTAKGFALYSIETSHAAWVTLYTSTAARTADASRAETTDPTPGSGVLAEVITTGSTTQSITPASICFNSAGVATTYAKIVNKSGSTANISVTLTFLKLEA
jgi:hypothetical protein|tara:strand:- start:6929 stop:7768 length:840 start_codon:yes stop_codon:yes gene_type:complete